MRGGPRPSSAEGGKPFQEHYVYDVTKKIMTIRKDTPKVLTFTSRCFLVELHALEYKHFICLTIF